MMYSLLMFEFYLNFRCTYIFYHLVRKDMDVTSLHLDTN